MIKTLKIKIFIILYVVVVLLLMSCIHYCNTGQTDSVYEELAEDIIEEFSGIEIDFSPQTETY